MSALGHVSREVRAFLLRGLYERATRPRKMSKQDNNGYANSRFNQDIKEDANGESASNERF
jgi:hypothetical protein